MTTIIMPRLADTMEEGTIVAWLKAVGDRVTRGEEICEIEMEKATLTFESHVTGVLRAILVQAGETAPVGTPIAEIETDG